MAFWNHLQLRIVVLALLALFVGHFTLAELVEEPVEANRPEPTTRLSRAQWNGPLLIPKASEQQIERQPTISEWTSITLTAEQVTSSEVADDQWTAYPSEKTFPEDDPLLSPFGPHFEAPGELPFPEDAQPLTDNAPLTSEQLDDAIELVVPELNPEEREVWREELDDIAPEAAMDILDLRKQLGATAELSDLVPESVIDGPVLSVPEPMPELPLHQVSLPHASETHYWVTGAINSLEQAVDVHLHNIANASTNGYQRREPVLKQIALRNSLNSAAGPMPAFGVEFEGTSIDFKQGKLRQTDRIFDLAIDGDGYFILERDDGEACYARGGSFRFDIDATIVLADEGKEWRLMGNITLPPDAANTKITSDGTISCDYAGERDVQLGTIMVARFMDPSQLIPDGPLIYQATPAAGEAYWGTAGTNSLGEIRSGYLETSTVIIEDEIKRITELRQQIDVLRNFTGSAAIATQNGPALPRSAANTETGEDINPR